MDEVGTALIAIALVLTAVFVPTAFIGGITGQFYRQFAVTVATATIISAFNSLTLSPALCASCCCKPHDGHAKASLLMRPVHAVFRAFDHAFDALAARLRHAGAHPGTRVWLLVLVDLRRAAGRWPAGFVHTPTGFIPKLDRAIIIISLQLPPGASLARTDAVVRRATDDGAGDAGRRQYLQRLPGTHRRQLHLHQRRADLFLVLDDFEERQRQGPDRRSHCPDDPRARSAQIEEAQTARVHPAAGARHGRGSRASPCVCRTRAT